MRHTKAASRADASLDRARERTREAAEQLKKVEKFQHARRATRDQAIHAASQQGATVSELAEACELSEYRVREAIKGGPFGSRRVSSRKP